MPQTLIVHLGLHKTATTALQDFLAGQRRALLERGVRYLPLNQMRAEVTPLVNSGRSEDGAALERLIGRIAVRAALLSDENILGVPGDIVDGALYPFAETRIRRLCARFEALELRLLLTLRSPAAFVTSMYCEYLRHNPFLAFEEYVRRFDVENFSYLRLFDWLFSLPPNARARAIPFEERHGGGVERIAAAVVEAACGPDGERAETWERERGGGVDFAAFPTEKSRASFSAEEIETAAEIALRADPRTAQFFLNMLDARGRRFGKTRLSPLPTEIVAALEARYTEELAVFARLG